MNYSKKQIGIINNYNKYRFILNTLETLRYDLILTKNSSIEKFENLNLVFIFLEKLFIEQLNSSETDKSEKNPSILFLNRNDIIDNLKDTKFSHENLKNQIEKTLLDQLEFQLKTTIKNKNKLCEAFKIGK